MNMSSLRDRAEERALDHYQLLVRNDWTTRKIAQHTGWSKSTIHKDLTVVLKELHPSKYERACMILKQHKAERSMNGGIATKRKYLGSTGGGKSNATKTKIW